MKEQLISLKNDDRCVIVHHRTINRLGSVTLDMGLTKTEAFDTLMTAANLPFRKTDLTGWRPEKDHPITLSGNAYHTHRNFFIHHGGELIKLSFLYPTTVNYHWLLGNYYGYPDCCIQDHIKRLALVRDPTNNQLFEEQKERIQKHGLPRGGPVWCNRCITQYTPRVLEEIKEQRLSPTPLFEGTLANSHIDAVLHYLQGNMTPWTPYYA